MYDNGAIAKPAVSTYMTPNPADQGTTVIDPQLGQAELTPLWALDVVWHVQGKRVSDIKISDLLGFANTKWEAKWAPLILGLFGVMVMGVAFINSHTPLLSISLALAGVSIISVSILYYFVTPSRLIVNEVFDSVSVTNTELMNTLLEPLVGNEQGVYIPSSIVGKTQVFLLTKDSEFSKAYNSSTASVTGINDAGKNCVFLTPPGYGLLSYVKSLGASFTNEGLEDEIKDVLVNGLELAPSAEVTRIANHVYVRVGGLADTPMCKAMRPKGGKACYQIGCPVCSFISCMVVEGTGKRAMVSDVKSEKNAIVLTYTLL